MPEEALRHFLWLSVAVGKLFDPCGTLGDAFFHGHAVRQLAFGSQRHVGVVDGTGVDIVVVQSLQIVTQSGAEPVKLRNDKHQKAHRYEQIYCTSDVGFQTTGGRAHSIHKAEIPTAEAVGIGLANHTSS